MNLAPQVRVGSLEIAHLMLQLGILARYCGTSTATVPYSTPLALCAVIAKLLLIIARFVGSLASLSTSAAAEDDDTSFALLAGAPFGSAARGGAAAGLEVSSECFFQLDLILANVHSFTCSTCCICPCNCSATSCRKASTYGMSSFASFGHTACLKILSASSSSFLTIQLPAYFAPAFVNGPSRAPTCRGTRLRQASILAVVDDSVSQFSDFVHSIPWLTSFGQKRAVTHKNCSKCRHVELLHPPVPNVLLRLGSEPLQRVLGQVLVKSASCVAAVLPLSNDPPQDGFQNNGREHQKPPEAELPGGL